MSKMKWKIFGEEGGNDARDYIDSVRIKLGLGRKELSEDKLNISNRTLHGWMTQNKIPTKYFEAMERLCSEDKPKQDAQKSKSNKNSLADYSDGELIAELVNRGIKINLGN